MLYDREKYVRWMKQDWNRRARENPMYWIHTKASNAKGRMFRWDEDQFFATGVEICEREVLPLLKELKLNPSDKVALDIGCGIGRVTFALAFHFSKVYGIDVSEDMICEANRYAQIKELNRKVEFLANNGVDLSEIASGSIDFCFSFLVFQHIPNRQIVRNYLDEIARVLKPGGFFKIQLRGVRKLFGIVDSKKVPWIHKRISVSIFPNTMRGVALSKKEVLEHLEGKLSVLDVRGEGTQYLWVTGGKIW